MRIIGVVGWSGSGKTTLIERMIPWFTARGVSVSTMKHAHHGFDMDRQGKLRPQTDNNFFSDRMSSRLPVAASPVVRASCSTALPVRCCQK